MHALYYEGKLQLRNAEQHIIDFVYSLISSREDVRIAKVEKVRNGIDVYISSQKYLQIIGKKLQKQFRGELKISRRLHGRSRSSSRDLYRLTVLFRLPKFKKGDRIVYKGKELLVVDMQKKVFCREVKTGRKWSISYGKLC